MATPRDLGRTLARFVKPEPATWVALASNAGMGFARTPDGSTLFDLHAGDRAWRHFLLDWLNWSDTADALHEYLAARQLVVHGKAPAESTDPVFAAIEEHRTIHTALHALPDDAAWPRELCVQEVRTIRALISTVPTTLAGCTALARYAQTQNLGDMDDQDDEGLTPAEQCLKSLATALDSLAGEAWA